MNNNNNNKRIVDVRNLVKSFPLKAGGFSFSHLRVHAINDISFYINEGETLGLVGESGCGKTTTGRLLLRMYEPTEGACYIDADENEKMMVEKLREEYYKLKIKINSLKAEGYKVDRDTLKKFNKIKKEYYNAAKTIDIFKMDKNLLREKRKDMQIVFQDPFSSLDPRMLVKDIIAEAIIEHMGVSWNEAYQEVFKLLDIVGLPKLSAHKYPHEFSGGQRQRISIARALAVKPRFVIADEATSALDVSIQSQILNLLLDLQREFKLTYLFISHNLTVINYMSDRIAVMYLGKIVEIAKSEELYKNPRHPYTVALLSAIPVADPDHHFNVIPIEGDVPSPIYLPKGCYFRSRCRFATEKCATEYPELKEVSPGHYLACHNPVTRKQVEETLILKSNN